MKAQAILHTQITAKNPRLNNQSTVKMLGINSEKHSTTPHADTGMTSEGSLKQHNQT